MDITGKKTKLQGQLEDLEVQRDNLQKQAQVIQNKIGEITQKMIAIVGAVSVLEQLEQEQAAEASAALQGDNETRGEPVPAEAAINAGKTD